jgi:poly [ADP-ribose] polymerase
MSEIDPESMKVDELKAELKERGLPTSGRKADLVKRLTKALEDDDDDNDNGGVVVEKNKKRKAAEKPKAKEESVSEDEDEDDEDDDSEEEEKAPPAKKAKTGKAKVDDVCPLSSSASVHEDYDCMLNQTNIKQNNNKFYVLQMLEKGSSYYVWTRWGRVGERGQFKNMGPMGIDKAIKDFEKKFKDKTGNEWGSRANFKPKSGKYTLIEMDYDDEDAEELEAALKKTIKNKQGQTIAPSELPAPTQNLMKLIFNHDMFQEAMQNFNIDTQKMPLGKISKSMIQRGYDVLEDIENVIRGNSKQSLADLWSTFYTVIPHSFGRQRPPVLRDLESVQQKKDMLNVLNDIEIAQQLTKEKEEAEASQEESAALPNPLDADYKLLNCGLEPVAKGTDEYEKIDTYLKNTRGYYKLDMLDVFRVDRKGEADRFQEHDDITHRKLLWHGTSVAVVVAILSTGLRIMPHSGGRVGRGIYFASENEKSAGYVGRAGNIGIMFLNEVCLGKEHSITRDDSTLRKAPAGYDSVVARGHHEPDPAEDTTLEFDGKTCIVPQGKPITMPEYQGSSFAHSEYLVYKESQCRIRYLLKLRFNN